MGAPVAALFLLVAGAALCALAWSLAPARSAGPLNSSTALRVE